MGTHGICGSGYLGNGLLLYLRDVSQSLYNPFQSDKKAIPIIRRALAICTYLLTNTRFRGPEEGDIQNAPDRGRV